MQYIKKFNNNVALVKDLSEKEWIVIGKGIGFGKKVGDSIATSEIERRFLAEPSQEFSYIVQTIFSMDADIIEAVNEMIHEVEKTLEIQLKDKNYITLLDHINFALKRTSEGLDYSVPMKWEMKRLHPKEYQAAVSAINYLNQRLGVHLPRSEETFITMHFINAQDGSEKFEQTDRINIIIRGILSFIGNEYAIDFDKDATNYIRFVTHLRYFIIRQMNNESLQDSELDRDLMELITAKYHEAHQVAVGVGEKLRRDEGWNITSNELLYLTIHIWRVTDEIGKK